MVDPQSLELPDYAFDVTQRLQSLSSMPIRVAISDGFQLDSSFSFASSEQPYHELQLHERYIDHLAHCLISGCMKGIRLYEAPAFERKYICPPHPPPWVPADVIEDVRTTLDITSDREVMRYAARAYAMTVQHLASTPIDLRAEQSIANELPAHSEKQQAYLQYRIQRHDALFEQRDGILIQTEVEQAMVAMSLTASLESSRIGDLPESPQVRDHNLYAIAQELQQIIQDPVDAGYPGDRDIIDGWADWLNIGHWYEWAEIDLA